MSDSMSDSSDLRDDHRAQRVSRDYTRSQQLPYRLREVGSEDQPLRVQRGGTNRQWTAALPMYGPDSVFETGRRMQQIEHLQFQPWYHDRSEGRLRGTDVVYRPRPDSQESYLGGDGNRELTTSYIQDGYDYGALGDIYTVVGRPAPPQARRQMPYSPDSNGGYDTRATEAGRAFRQYGAGTQGEQYRDTGSFDADVDMSMSREQRGPSRQNSGFERSGPSSSRQISGSETTGSVDTRRSGRDSSTETYVNGNAWYYYARSQDPERRR